MEIRIRFTTVVIQFACPNLIASYNLMLLRIFKQ